MEEKTVTNNTGGLEEDLNPEIFNKYFSVEFSLNGMGPTYLFKLRDIPYSGLCILVKEDSVVLKHLKVGDILNMKYNPLESSCSSILLKTRIRDISKNPQGRLMGHSIAGLSIIYKQDGR
ncbi:MAG: hypothetical protein MUO88_23805 [Desulfobacterales bacterium]|nr:hypothetical protein [Desulfobacterales bacterium]